MRDELAEELLARVMHWDAEQVADVGAKLQTLARHKYDRYGGYRPGEKFLESLAQWLDQFPIDDRTHALEFVLKQLVFVTSAELNHAIEVVYPDFLRPRLISRVSANIHCPPYQVVRITGSREFRILQRRVLILGLSDGSRLDLLRRACPEFSHEQFWLTPELGDEAQKQMVEKLDEALNQFNAPNAPRTFVEVVLAEDFSGSGFTLLHRGANDTCWKGKLAKTYKQLERLRNCCIDPSAHVLVLVYVASAQAADALENALAGTGWQWDLKIIQKLPNSIVVTDHYMRSLSEWYFDPSLIDEHKGKAPLGYGGCSLPLILEHNTPNNSISPLWADTSSDPHSQLHRHALFPRYERHHKDRP